MTTERRHGVSARTRILAWILLTVTVALVALVGVTARTLLVGVDTQANTELSHEVEKFRLFAAQPDPATGGSFTSVRRLLTSHLQRTVPDHAEAFFSIVDGHADRRSLGDPPARLDGDAAFVARARTVEEPTWGTTSTGAGAARYAIIPVRIEGDPARGHLVIVEFLADSDAEAWSLIWTMAGVGLLALTLAGVIGWFVSGRVLAPIGQVRRTAALIGETDLGRRIEVTGTDDVALLARTFNTMFDRLEVSFDGQRRFLDDAGHELRTPITVIRGHLDVMSEDPEDREQTIEIVQDELGRMSRLVDDLVMLARSDRPDFLRLAPTNLTELVVETFAKASALAPRRWIIEAVPDSVARIDAQRITQALLQLASNAVTHTAPADTVAFGGSDEGGVLRFWVRDTGRGIAAADRERIFHRFARGAGESRGSGSGLGLAIVARIADAHGGRVAVESEEGRGATFTLVLPRHDQEEGTT